MQLIPRWEAASCAATKELSNILWNPKIHNGVYKNSPLVSILSQINPVHTTPSYFSKIHFISYSYFRLGLPSGLYLLFNLIIMRMPDSYVLLHNILRAPISVQNTSPRLMFFFV
jgi:hypothetical protein